MRLNELGKEYDFLKGADLCYLVVAGSRAYGTDVESSDLDLRGCYLDKLVDVLGIGEKKKEEIEDRETDTVVYSLRKYAMLLAKCNPNVIESLGVRDCDVVHCNEIGKKLREKREMFLSKRAYVTFAQYAEAQLRRLENALARDSYPDEEKEKHILKSIKAMLLSGERMYTNYDKVKEMRLEIGEDEKIEISVEIEKMPLRDFLRINSDLSNMLRNYGKLTGRNKKKDEAHLNKHAMHLIRLYYMGIDILKNREIVTYREKEHDLLMSIRHGEMPYSMVFELQRKLKKELDEAYDETKLEEEPDYKKINAFLEEAYIGVKI